MHVLVNSFTSPSAPDCLKKPKTKSKLSQKSWNSKEAKAISILKQL